MVTALTLGALAAAVQAGTPLSPPVKVVTAPAPTAAPPRLSGTQTATLASAAQAAKPASLSKLDLSNMRLWNWAAKWHASEWANAFSPIPWKYDHVRQLASGATQLTLDRSGAPQLTAQGGIPAIASGLWETDVTLPRLASGVIVAPLWLYDGTSKDEIDFEFAGRNGLDVSLHRNVGGVVQHASTRLFAGQDMSGQRHRFGIKVDQYAGYIEMYLDGKRVHRWDRAKTPLFVSHRLKPVMEMWVVNQNDANFVAWAGKVQGMPTGGSMVMTVHGYGYTSLK